jgi:hypothetical protein
MVLARETMMSLKKLHHSNDYTHLFDGYIMYLGVPKRFIDHDIIEKIVIYQPISWNWGIPSRPVTDIFYYQIRIYYVMSHMK